MKEDDSVDIVTVLTAPRAWTLPDPPHFHCKFNKLFQPVLRSIFSQTYTCFGSVYLNSYKTSYVGILRIELIEKCLLKRS